MRIHPDPDPKHCLRFKQINRPKPPHLAHGLLPVPALEEDLLWVRVEQADHPKVVDNLGPGNIQLLVEAAPNPAIVKY